MSFPGGFLLCCVLFCPYVPWTSARIAIPSDANIDRNNVITNRPCPCKDPALCSRIESRAKNEVYIFGGGTIEDWRRFEFSKISTVAEIGEQMDEHVCLAHAHGVRFVHLVSFPTHRLPDAAYRSLWVDWMISNVTAYFYDGLNLDFEGDVPTGRSDLRNGLTKLAQELSWKLRAQYPHTQLSFDFPSTPRGWDRWYDYKAITDVMDFVFLMDYTEGLRSRPHLAGANSNFTFTLHGILEYIKFGIDPDKIVMGVPWYGFMYNCTKFEEKSHHCVGPRGKKYTPGYGTIIQELLPHSTSGRLWDSTARSPFADFQNKTGLASQLWYDDVESLGLKYDLAKLLGLRGVGVWQAGFVNYSSPQQIKDMWGHFPYTF